MSAHTPGPWVTQEVGEFVSRLAVMDSHNVSLLTIVEEEGVKFAAVFNEADADLIAAAPELLAALQGAINAFDDMDVMNGWDALARAAIAKATGG